MAQPFPAFKSELVTPRPRDAWRTVALWGGAGAGAVVLLAALALWFRYGTAVFFETIAAGFAGCF